MSTAGVAAAVSASVLVAAAVAPVVTAPASAVDSGCTVPLASTSSRVMQAGEEVLMQVFPPDGVAAGLSQSTIVDADLGVAFDEGYSGGFGVVTYRAGQGTGDILLMGPYAPTNPFPRASFEVTYDDEAPTPLAPDSPSGRYQPPAGFRPLSDLDGALAFPGGDPSTYVLKITNINGPATRVRGFGSLVLANCTSTPPPPPAAYDREVSLRLKKATRRATGRLVGRVTSAVVGCRSRVAVAIDRTRGTSTRRVVALTTRRDGSFSVRAPRKPGRYVAVVSQASEPLCADDTSPRVRLRRGR